MRSVVAGLLVAAVAAAADISGDIRAAVERKNFALAEQEVRNYRAAQGVTPELAEAISWMARGALSAGSLDKAATYAAETHKLALELLKGRPLDAEPHLPNALGAAIEVQAQVLQQRGARDEALRLLHQQLQMYWDTSIRARIQKNVHLLSLEGKPAPALNVSHWVGSQPLPLEKLRGKPVLIFFWAHWCPDCRAEARSLTQVARQFGPRGLVLIAPTQCYGYTQNGLEATREEELRYIGRIWDQYYAGLVKAVPVDEENFKTYGSSTTPTTVLVDRKGIVRMYHPGAMSFEEMAQAIRAVLAR